MASVRIGLLACALAVAPATLAFAQEPQAVSSAKVPGPTADAHASGRSRTVARPIMFGVIAMAFLIASGLAAHTHRKARSRRGGSL
jgi:hypothetical protein